LREALLGVYEPNWRDLQDILDAVDDNRSAELWHEIVFGRDRWPIPIAETASAQISRHLHNYLASSATVVEHVRRIDLRGSASLVAEYEQRKMQIVSSPEISFVPGLRNFTLHRSLPLLGYNAGVQLSGADLLAGSRWSVEMRRYIASYGESIPLRPIVQQHHKLIYTLNTWLLDKLLPTGRAGLDEASELIEACREALKRLTMYTAAKRQSK